MKNWELPIDLIDRYYTLEHCDLNDLGYEGDKFTWANHREGELFTKERIDRCLGNSTWLAKLEEDYSVHHLAAATSNHMPLLFKIQEKLTRLKPKRVFRYEASWSRKEDCKALVKQS